MNKTIEQIEKIYKEAERHYKNCEKSNLELYSYLGGYQDGIGEILNWVKNNTKAENDRVL